MEDDPEGCLVADPWVELGLFPSPASGEDVFEPNAESLLLAEASGVWTPG